MSDPAKINNTTAELLEDRTHQPTELKTREEWRDELKGIREDLWQAIYKPAKSINNEY